MPAQDAKAVIMEKHKEVLREVLHRIAKNNDFNDYKLDIKTTTTEGANFSSELFFVTISEENKDDINLFAKVACIGQKVREDAPYKMFETEIFFYTDLIKTYKNIESKHNILFEDRLITPTFYGFNHEYLKETIVMEDLTQRGYQMFDRFKTIDWNYAKESLKQLAKLHALSMAYSMEQPDEFDKKTINLKMQKDMNEMKEGLVEILAKILESASDEHMGRIKAFLEMNSPDKLESMMKPIKRAVLGHGDYRPSNLMHKLHEDGTYDVVPIDYQTLNRSNPIIDILYFIFNGSDKQFRAEYYQKSLDHYYSELCTSLQKLHLEPNEVYSREDFEYELKQVLPLGLLMSLILLMMITVDMEKMPKTDEETDFKDFYLSPNEEYKKRMYDLVEDCIKLGVL